MGGALIGKSRLLEIDAREFVSSHTDCGTTPANALSAHLQENGFFLGTFTGMISGALPKIQVINWCPASKAPCVDISFFLALKLDASRQRS